MTTCAICQSATTGASKYCKSHAKQARQAWLERVQKSTADREARYAQFAIAWRNAVALGREAYNATELQPQAVVNAGGQVIGTIPDCYGWAWLSVRPASSSFGRWLVKQGLGSVSHYDGGVRVSMGTSAPDYTRKVAQANAMADALSTALRSIKGSESVRVYSDSRLD